MMFFSFPFKRCRGWLCLSGMAAMLCVGFAHAADGYSVCAEPSANSPSLRWKTNPAAPDQKELTGFRLELTQILFKRIGVPVAFRGDLPWSRCMRLAAEGEIDCAVGAYQDPERARIYAFSKPFQTLTPQVFLRADSPLKLIRTSELRQYRGCGMNGSSYAHYGLDAKDLELGAVNYAGLIQKLKAGRCDYFVEELEVIHHLDGGRYRNDPDMRSNAIAGATAPTRHFATRHESRGAALLPALNEALESLRKSGELDRLWKKHSSEVAG